MRNTMSVINSVRGFKQDHDTKWLNFSTPQLFKPEDREKLKSINNSKTATSSFIVVVVALTSKFTRNHCRYSFCRSLVVFQTVTASSEHKHQLNRKNLLQRAACLKHKE